MADAMDPIPAATLVAFRNGNPAPEILMIRRSKRLAFGGGAAVFPGGRIDAGDEVVARDLAGDPAWNLARVAAVRETLEETGLLTGVSGAVDADKAAAARAALLEGAAFADVLDRFGWAIDTGALIPFARWIPPVRIRRRFDTFFLLTDLGTGSVTLSADGTETTEHFWTAPGVILERDEREDEALMFPTRMNLLRLSRFADFAAARADAEAHDPAPVHPIVEEREGESWLVMPEGRGYAPYAEPLASARRHH